MKQILILSLFISNLAFSGTTGTLVLQGTIPEILSIEVIPENTASMLDFSETVIKQKVGTAITSSNSQNGYKILVASLNKGNLVNIDGNNIPYQLFYNDNSIILDTESIVDTTLVPELTPKSNDISISFEGKPLEQFLSGSYTDTVLFTIQAN